MTSFRNIDFYKIKHLKKHPKTRHKFTGALSGKMLLVRIVETNKIYDDLMIPT